MDPGSDSSDGEHDLSGVADAPSAMAMGAGLKPQMDSIFAELEKSLPSIDFDMSDVSSDSEEPMIFHRHLKMSELDYNDEKDLDTSLSGESAKGFFKSPPGFFPIPSLDKNNASLPSSPTLAFDNDLAALLAAREGHKEDEEHVSSWKDLERLALHDKQRQKAKEDATPSSLNTEALTGHTETDKNDNFTDRPTENSNSPSPATLQAETVDSSDTSLSNTILEAGNLILAQLAENARAGRSVFGARTFDFDTAGRHPSPGTPMGGCVSSSEVSQNENGTGKKRCNAMVSTGRDTTTTTTTAGNLGSEASTSARDGAGMNRQDVGVGSDGQDLGTLDDRGEMDSNREVERIFRNRERWKEREMKEREEQRRKEKDLALTYMSSKAPQLSTQILDAIDWDSPTLNEDVETMPWHPPPEVRAQLPPLSADGQLQPPSSSSSPDSAQGKGDGKTTASGTENLTLIQKLARFSSQQTGRNTDMNIIDPCTGASMEVIGSSDTSSSSSSSTASSSTTSPGSSERRAESGEKAGNLSEGATGCDGAVSRSLEVTKAKTDSPPPPSAAMTAMLETLNKRKPEPETVYLDLRGFSRHREEEKQSMATVSRVLGLPADAGTVPTALKGDSSDSEDEERWIQQRQQIKNSLTSRASVAPSSTQQRLQPTRVIPLQPQSPGKRGALSTSRGVSTSSCGVSASLASSGHAGSAPASGPGRSAGLDGGDSNRQLEEEEHRLALLAREKEKERQKEAARLARVEKEKVRSSRLRMLHHLEGLRSTAAVSENKPCGENTPVLFDLEASYEPRLPVLPTCLEREERLLITINLSSNGEITLHNARSTKTSAETVINALPKSYLSLVCWLVSLIPPDLRTARRWLEQPEEGVKHCPPGFPPFHVIGLQQLLVQGALCLAVVVCPSLVYMLHKDDRTDRLKKGKKGEEASRFHRFVDTFISRNSLASVESWPQYLGGEEEEDASEYMSCLSFANPYLPFLSKPMSAYMQLHRDQGAVDMIFNKDVGFFWQTVDPLETAYQHELRDTGNENAPQSSLFLLSKQALFRPQVVYETLLRVVSQSLDISGLRVLYPSLPENPHPQPSSTPPQHTSAEQHPNPEGATPVLAVAVRGPHARIRLISIVGPTDYSLAKKTDPHSLTALFGRAETGLQIFCPRNAERAQCELARWFGGRVMEESQGSMEVGLPYRLQEQQDGGGGGGGGGGVGGVSASSGGKGKRGKKAAGGTSDPLLESKPARPPAALTATTLGHVVLVVSPIVPVWILGFLVSLVQQKAAFQPRGLRRLCLSVKKANSLGIPSEVRSLFCPGVNLEVADIDSGEHQMESYSPCTLLILERENASHHTASLTHILVAELKNENYLDIMKERTETPFDPLHLFHLADYSDTLLTSLGGNFSKCPSFDPMCDVRGPLPPLYGHKELEQVSVLILLGKDLLKDWGSFLQKLQTFSTSGGQVSDFELLGVKWLAGMNSFQTREVTPYEIGDNRWRPSIRFMAHESAVVLALRSVNAFKKLEPFVSLPVTTSTSILPPHTSPSPRHHLPLHGGIGSSSAAVPPHPTRLMSRSPKDSYLWLRLFFWPQELFPDPDSRTLLPYLPESRLYFHTLPGVKEGSKPRITPRSIESQDLLQENVLDSLLYHAAPLTTFLLVKPHALRRHLPKILRRVLHEGFSVVGLRLGVMEEGAARTFLALDFENGGQVHDLHLQYLTSEPSLYLALWRENAVKKLLDLVGPEDPQQARRQSQFYWRGIYGSDLIHNGLYASRTYIESVWDLHTFFPDGLCCDPTYHLDCEQIPCPAVDGETDVNFLQTRSAVARQSAPASGRDSSSPSAASSPISDTEKRVHSLLMQSTCLVLPPALMVCGDDGTDAPFVDVISLLLNRGFELVGARMVWLTQQQAEQLLHTLHRSSFETVSQMTSAPCLVLALERDNAVLAFQNTLGSGSEAQAVLTKYRKDIYRPTDIRQAHQLLALFFRHLTPGSHLHILPLHSPSPHPQSS
ncbi:hypothetical protein ACOMHN_021251 [Nucella lapillus]